MLKGKHVVVFCLILVTALFIGGVIELMILRFQTGDVYPPYSSYRSDPLGAKVFYEGLRLIPGVETIRNIEPLSKASGLSEATLFLFGIQKSEFYALERSAVKTLEDAALAGGRIVISFVPATTRPPSPGKEPLKEESSRQGPHDEDKIFPGEWNIDLATRWGLRAELSRDKEEEARLQTTGEDLPSGMAWHSTLVFEVDDPAWRTIYLRAGKPVLVERSFGKGTLVLSSDSFFLSNEAMKNDRSPRLLSWLCGAHRRVIFDETHLGVSRSPGIAALLRQYGLAPLFVSFAVLALLAVWKQSSRFMPPYEEEGQAVVDAGKDSSAGLTNLLRRNIPSDSVLNSCLEEWKRSFTHGHQDRSSLLPRIEQIIARERARPRKDRNPAEAYRRISRLGRSRRSYG